MLLLLSETKKTLLLILITRTIESSRISRTLRRKMMQGRGSDRWNSIWTPSTQSSRKRIRKKAQNWRMNFNIVFCCIYLFCIFVEGNMLVTLYETERQIWLKDYTGCSLNIVFISKNFRKFATSPSPAFGCYWLYKILPANRRDCTLWRSLTAI